MLELDGEFAGNHLVVFGLIFCMWDIKAYFYLPPPRNTGAIKQV